MGFALSGNPKRIIIGSFNDEPTFISINHSYQVRL